MDSRIPGNRILSIKVKVASHKFYGNSVNGKGCERRLFDLLS